MSRLAWISPAVTDLTTVSEGYFWAETLSVTGNSTPVTFKVISGSLPPGITIHESAGRLYGVPVVTSLYQDINDLTPDTLAGANVDISRPYKFTIRAQENTSVVDRSFSLTITNLEPPVILPRTISPDKELFLGAYLDGTIIDQQFEAIEINPGATLQWSVIDGELPDGLSLSSTGRLTGYLIPIPTIDDTKGAGWDGSRWSVYPWDFIGIRVEKTFRFTLQVYDGENFDTNTYTFSVYPRNNATADNGYITADNGAVDSTSDPLHTPILLNTEYILPDARQLSSFTYKFDAVDLDGDAIRYNFYVPGYGRFDESSDPLWVSGPPYPDGGFDWASFDLGASYFPGTLTMESKTGWLHGYFDAQTEEKKYVTFQVSVSKVDIPAYESPRKSFTLQVLGNLIDLVNWDTAANLGLIENGGISEFRLSTVVTEPIFANTAGTSPNVDLVTYSLTSDSGPLPVGLDFNSNGLINGRCSFDYYKLDGGDTSLDNGSLTFDAKYTFTANATGYNSVTGNIVTSSLQDFTITVNNINTAPYEDIYIRALTSVAQRTLFTSITGNTSIFSSDLIYRANDPHFGVNRSITSLFLPGLTPQETYVYAEATQTNHYNKSILFGDIKTAVALDENFNPKYEVVYVELLDSLVNSTGASPPIAQPLTNGMGHMTGSEVHDVAYINSFVNMKQLVESRVGYNKKGALPDWMTSKQPNGKILGFTRCVVLCYLNPSVNKKNAEIVAVRLRNHLAANDINFNQIEFVADRYVLDTNLENYPNLNDKYIKFPKVGVFI